MDHCRTTVTLSQDHIILSNEDHTLWCDRRNGRLTAGKGLQKGGLSDYVDLGKIWGIVGKICFFTDGEWKLIVITHASYVSTLPGGGEIYCVDRIGIIPLQLAFDINSELIGLKEILESTDQPPSTSPSTSLATPPSTSSLTSPSAAIRPNSPSPREKLLSLAVVAGGGGGGISEKDKREREKIEKRLTEVLQGMFNDSHSFYFSLNSDLTKPLQRQVEASGDHLGQVPSWEQVDERFFWNKWMISDLMDEEINTLKLSKPWILPLIQGYVEVRQIPVLCEDTPNILQPGWSEHYREERERILEECIDGSENQREWGSSVEVEMKDLSNLTHDGELLIPMQTLKFSGSGYETDSDDVSSSENGYRILSPTDSKKDEEEEEEATSAEYREREVSACVTDRGNSPSENTSLISRDDSSRGSSPLNVADENSHSSSPTDQDSMDLVKGETEGDNNSTASAPIEGGDELKDSSSCTLIEEEKGLNDNQVEPVIDGAMIYTFHEDPEMDGIMVDMVKLEEGEGGGGGGGRGGGGLEIPGRPIQTQGEPSSGLSSLSQNPSDSSPVMGNPFLESEKEEGRDEPSWMRHASTSSRGSSKGTLEGKDTEPPTFTLAIISRRSRYRAGTRYKRRGVDSEGHVANYVETEMVAQCGSHVISYVIIRGSVPVYWSQPGNKYRPLPVIENSVEETQKACKSHFEQELKLFKEIAAVNLVKQIGREKLVGDAFEDHLLLMDNPDVTYIAFDFHQSYKVDQNLAMQRLLEGTSEFIRKFKFYWIDTSQFYGPLCTQEGIFRINCMDCLDRTNVVESLFSREVLQIALQKLGVIPFDEKLRGGTLTSYQEMWANNGDIVSKQYAGTAAMKGDITRYGERKFSGMMKDGYNSAHRYYINIFRDTYRQVLIDLIQGVNPNEAFASLPNSMQGMDELEETSLPAPVDKVWSLEREEALGEMILQCQKELFPGISSVVGWVMVEVAGYSFLGDSKEDEPCVMVYCRKKKELCVAKFDMEAKKVMCFLRISIFQIEKITIGQLGIIIRNSKRLHMRIQYSLYEDTVYYFTFTTVNSVSLDEDKAILLSIAELLASYESSGIILQEQKLNKKKCPPHKGVIYLLEPEGTPKSPPPSSSSTGGEKRDSNEDKERSLSSPSSPELGSPLRTKHRHSSGDILSDEETLQPHSSRPFPSITVTSPGRKAISSHYQVLERSGDDDSGSESDVDGMFRSLPDVNLSSINPMVDFIGLDSSDLEGTKSDDEGLLKKSDDEDGGGGKFSRLKGRFLHKMKSSKNSFLPRHMQQASNESTSIPSPVLVDPVGSGADDSQRAGGDGGGGGANRKNSPNLWRKMRKTSPVGPSEEKLSRSEARKRSKSRIIYI